VFGSITAKGEHTITLLGRGGETLVLTVNDRTKYRIPGDADPSFDDLAAGHRVAALVLRQTDGLMALQIMSVPGQPQREHRLLTVVDVAGRTLTAKDAQGNLITVELDSEVSPELKGQIAVFIGEHSQRSNRFKAHAEVKIERVVERLEANAARLRQEAAATRDAEAKSRKEREMAKLEERLDANRQRHLERLEEVIAQVPEEAKDSLRMARERFKEQYATRLRNMDLEKPLDQPGRGQRPGIQDMDQPLGGPGGRPLPDTGVVKPGPRAVHGVVQAVDASARKISILTVDGTVTTVEMTADAEVLVGERAVPFGDQLRGERVTVHFNRERTQLDEIKLKKEAMEAEARAQAELEAKAKMEAEARLKSEVWDVLNGVLMSVEPEEGSLTVGTRDGFIQTIKTGPRPNDNVRASLKGLNSLRPGSDVTIKYRRSGGQIVELSYSVR
jgi:hypothetical protein